MPKTLGLLCGLTYHSTVTHYTLINKHTSALTYGKHTASLLLHSFDSPPMMSLVATGQWPKFTSILCTAANNLKASGANAIVICANIMHKAAPEVESRTGLPVLHIADFTGQRVVNRGFRRVGLLATKAVME
jgi:aspartate racemase